MPDKVTNELLYEVLKSVQAQVSIIREDTEHLKARATSIDTRLGHLHTDLAEQSKRLDRLDSCLSRVESRLNFGEQTQ